MGRKGKAQKHTAKEIAGKHKAAKERAGAAGHGKEGLASRQAKMNKVIVQCDICKAPQPHLAGMRNHYESKHAKVEYSDSMYESQFGASRQEAKAKTTSKKQAGSKDAGVAKKKSSKKKNDLSMLDGY